MARFQGSQEPPLNGSRFPPHLPKEHLRVGGLHAVLIAHVNTDPISWGAPHPPKAGELGWESGLAICTQTAVNMEGGELDPGTG